MLLFHPEKADPSIMLDLDRDSEVVERVMNWQKEAKRRSSASQLLRAAYLLRLQGAVEDARYLEDLSSRIDANVWAARKKTFASIRKDPKLKHIHAQSALTKQVWSELGIDETGSLPDRFADDWR